MNVLLQNCVAHGKKNFSVCFLYLVEWVPSFDDVTNIANIAGLVGRVFPSVRKVFFKKGVYFEEPVPANEVNVFSTAFQNLKFVITLCDDATTFIIFDPWASNDQMVKLTHLSTNEQQVDHILQELTCYPTVQKYQYLNTLCVSSWQVEEYSLDILQGFITGCPSLKSIYFDMGCAWFIPLTNPLSENNIEDLAFHFGYGCHSLFSIDDVFLQSFKNV